MKEGRRRQAESLDIYLLAYLTLLFCQGLVALSPTQLIQYQASMIEFEEEGIKHVKMFIIITLAYVIFWGPLFLVTLINISLDWKDAKSSVSHEVDILQTFAGIKVNPLHFMLQEPQDRISKGNCWCLGLTARVICPCHHQSSAVLAPPQTIEVNPPTNNLM